MIIKKFITESNLIFDIIKKRIEKNSYPRAIWIEPTNYCNLNCVFCFQSNNTMTRSKGFMSYKLFKKFIDDVEKFKPEIILHHSGESFLHNDLFKFIRYAKEKGLKVGMTTNGTLLSKNDFEILNTGIDGINISFAGVDEKDYINVRNKNKFEKIKNDTILLASKKVKINIKTKININAILTNENKDRIDKFKIFFESIDGIDKVIIRNLMSWHGKVNVNSIKNRSNELKQIVLDIKENFLIKIIGLCPSVYLSAGILWDGTVVPCCVDFNGSIPLGNINNQTFLDIWNGKRYQILRKNLKNKKLIKSHPICGPCLKDR